MEKVEQNLRKDKQKPPTFLLFLLIFILVVLYIIYKIGLNFKPVAFIEYEGYAVSGEELVENLLKSDLNAEEFIEPIKVKEDSIIYKKVASYFVGEEKKVKINLDYPIYINENVALLNMTDDIKLLTTDLETFEGYKDSALTDGGLYNITGLERADYNDYLFIKNSDNLYISSKKIIIKTITNTHIIPENSIINFDKDFITYYHMEDNVFKYKSIIDVSLDSKVHTEKKENKVNFENGEVEINSETIEYSYKDFLIKLNIIKENKKKDKETVEEKEEQTQKEPEKQPEKEDDQKNEITDNENNNVEQEKIWIKPTVTATDFIANVYTASTSVYIYDPSATIKKALVFEIYKDGKVYMRNQVTSSGNLRIGILHPDTEYEIKGKYQYINKEGKTIEVQFINQKIKTKDTSELKPLSLYFENNNIYSNKIELSNLRLNCDLNETSETIAGVKRAEIIINEEKHEVKSYDLRRILSGQTINLQSNNTLKSNSKYKFEIKFYDIANNLVQVNNNYGETNTCMQKPIVQILKENSKSKLNVTLKLKYQNPDEIIIKNQKYVIYSSNNEIVDQGEVKSDKIKPQNLNLDKYYTIKIYGDFDLGDNNGEQKEEVLGEFSFSTATLESFGKLYMDLNIENISSNSATLDFNINATTNRTNLELISMLKGAKVIILKDGEKYIEETLTQEEFVALQNLENVKLEIDGLESNSTYEIKIESTLQFEKQKEIYTAIINGKKKFNTLKEEAIINIKNLFILKDTIDFDINIYDKDGAIKDSIVTLEVISTRDEIIQTYIINASNKYNNYTRIQITDLLENEEYYLSLVAEKYSTRKEESTLSKKIFEFDGDEKRIKNGERANQKVGIVNTNKVGGNLSLQSVERNNVDITGNLIDVESNVNWYSECFNTEKGYLKEYDTQTKILKLGVGESTSQYYLYDLLSSYKEYNEEELEISFKYKISDSSLKVYLQKDVNSTITQLSNSNTTSDEDGWRLFKSKDILNTVKTKQYIGLLLDGKINSYIEIKEFQVKLKTENENEGIEEEPFTEYKYKINSDFILNLNLYDENLKEIGYEPNVTDGIYYIRVKNNTDNKITDYKYNDYIENASNDNGKNKNAIENYLLKLDLLENKQYEIMLLLKNPNVTGREYILSTIEVDTSNKEIKNISNEFEYLKIQPNGSYIVTDKNLNLGSGDYKFGNKKLKFNGFIDFNGNTLTREIVWKDEEYKYYLFYGFSENAVIKNLYFDFSINLKTSGGTSNLIIGEKNCGFVYENEGKISNIIVDLKSCTASPNRQFSIIGYENKGTLENFVIYLGSDYYLGGEGAIGFIYCTSGIIRNGYITQYPNTDYSIKPINCQPTPDGKPLMIAGLAARVRDGSQISNVYSLVTINNEDKNTGNEARIYAGNLISEIKNSKVKNVYSVGIGNITLDNSANETIGPTISYPFNTEDGNIVQNSYFIYESEINNNEYNTKVNLAALSNEEFQRRLLNSEESEKQFLIDSNIKNYFPKIKLSEIMPAQKNIPMKKTKETDADILLIDAIEDGDTEKLVEITLFNPKETKIDKIEIQGLEVDGFRVHSDKYCKNESSFEKCTGSDSEGYCLDKNGNRILVEEDGYTQNYESGQTTKLITKIKIPEEETLDENGFDSREYKSKYNLKTIRAKGYAEKNYFNEDGTIKITNEIGISYYYQIKDLNDWRRINAYAEQNYRIVSDLDFSNKDMTNYCISEVVKGKIDGQYKKEDGSTAIAKIKNIGKEGAEINSILIYKLQGANLSNLIIDGFNQKIEVKNVSTNMYMGGLIGLTTTGTIIDNVHMSNVTITGNEDKGNTGSFVIGGLISKSEGSIIRNSSVSYKVLYKNNELQSNIRAKENKVLSSATIGGLIGQAEEITISNCFTKNLYVNIKTNETQGMGGIVGSYIGEIYNCYSIGQIKTNVAKLGGIFGNAIEDEDSDDRVENICDNCYAMVNIKTESTNLGGIGGIVDSKSLKTMTNNISLGNLYTSTAGNMYLNRIVGNIENASSNTNNYGYTNQLINGFRIETNKKGANYLFTKEQFLSNNDNVFDEKVYNIADLEEEYIPRLKYKDSDILLPNQEEEKKKFPENPTLEIISARENAAGNIEVKILDENTVPISTSNISIKIENMANVEKVDAGVYNVKQKTHTIYVKGEPIYYLDSYEINSITYKDNEGNEFTAEVAVKLDYIQYKEIKTLHDWASEFSPEYSGYRYHTTEGDGKPQYIKAQNYKILADLPLSEIENLNGEKLEIPANMEIGRLIGDDSKPTISLKEGQELVFTETRSGLIKRITKEIKNLNFENITIKHTSGNYTGVISTCNEQTIIENLSFSNIHIEGPGSYVGAIGIAGSERVKNIEVKNVYCKGTKGVGGFVGYVYSGDISNIYCENVEVEAQTGFSGGAIGYVHYMSAYKNVINNINVSNVKVKNTGSGNCVGGIVGSQQCLSGSNYTINNVDIECKGGNNNYWYVAGGLGAIRGSVSNISVYGVNINVEGAITRVAGIIGNANGAVVSNAHIEGKEGYNTINAPRSNQLGIIVAYSYTTIDKVFAKGINIIGNTYVGGVLGYAVTGVTITDAIVQDCTITGNSRVGGMLGALEKYGSVAKKSLEICNSYTNSKIVAKSECAGGMVGFVDNSTMNNATHVSKIYNNYIACSEISSPRNVGSLIGKITKALYYLNDATKYYYGNLVITNIDDDYPIGNIDQNLEEITEQVDEEEIEIKIVEPEEIKRRLFNSLFYQYQVNDKGEKVLEKSKLDTLKQNETYTKTLIFGTKYNYSNIETMFPLLIKHTDKEVTFYDGTTHKYIQTGIKLPKETEDTLLAEEMKTFSLRNYLKQSLPYYKVYTVGANKINIEFSQADGSAYFKYEDSKGNISDEIVIDKKTYTLEYDFTSDFKIIVGNSKNTEEKIIKPGDINKKVSIINSNYYYLKDNTLKVSLDTIEGEFVNLFEEEALTIDGQVYNLINNVLENEKIEGLRLLEKSIPIAKNIYLDNIIETYYDYSKIINTEENNVDYQIFNKNQKIFILDGKLDIYADSIIIDAYNNKEYQTVLGTDGKIYDIKEKINYPENFINENIIQMTNNINKDENKILVMYKDGRVYAFNYITGSVLFDSNNRQESTLIIPNTNSMQKGENLLYNLDKKEYETALDLQERLVETPIEVAEELLKEKLNVESNQTSYNSTGTETNQTTSNETNSNTSNNSSVAGKNHKEYTTVYDSNTNQYLVYKTEDFIKTNSETKEIVSETEKINSTPVLKEYYNSANTIKSYNKTNGIYFVIVTIISILIILIAMYKKKNY